MTKGINDLIEVMENGNYYYDKTIVVAKRQTEIAQRGLIILEQSRPCHYREHDVWGELENFNITPEVQMKCYKFLC